MVFPWLVFLKEKRKRLSDIEFLSIKEFDTKRVDVDGEDTNAADNTNEDVVTQTANSGKDMYLGGAKFNVRVNTGGGSPWIYVVDLVINGVIEETYINATPPTGEDFEYTFLTKGVKVAATQIIKIQHRNATASKSTTCTGKLVLWEETTGASPAV